MFNILKECKDAARIAISGHIRPDGDCIGSAMSLKRFLEQALPETEIDVYLEKPAAVFNEIAGISEIIYEYDRPMVYDVFFVVDSIPERIGQAFEYYSQARKTVNIDHHVSNTGSSTVNYIVPEASSASELIYDLILHCDPEKKYLDEETAKAIYIGIIHDTGVLQYSNTAPKTLRVVADLISYGFDFSRLIDETFYEKTYAQSQILGRALLESFRFMEGKCAVTMVNRRMMEFYNVTVKDFEGIVNQLRIIKGVEVAIFMYETGTLEYKVALRSCGLVDVAKIAAFFGGGGHMRAAGCDMKGTYHDVINNLSDQIARQM